MRLRPLNNTLILEPDEEEFTDSNAEIVRILKEGLIKIPEQYEGWFKKSPMKGTLISWGPECKYFYKTGDRLIYGRFSGAPFNFEGKKYLILTEFDLLAKEENDLGQS